MKKIFVFLSAIVVVAGLLGFIVIQQFFSKPAGPGNTEVVFEVNRGRTFQGVARELEERGLIRNSTLFSLWVRVTGQSGKLKVGEYALRENMTPKQIMSVITSGISVGKSFTVSEGLNIFEISENFERQGFGTKTNFIKACMDKAFLEKILSERVETCEGYLFPETYQLTKYTTAQDLVKNMMDRFLEVYSQSMPAQLTGPVSGWTRHQVVTLASIIEKETGAPEERARISSIFHNRLKKGMLLQTDPTIIYGMAMEAGRVVLKISRADIRRPTRYNTYVIKGLPPGPIANPGKEALLATIEPENTNYLFFVSQNDGTHIFSETYADHNKAVQQYQVNKKAREGKSWRDLKKRK